MESLTRDFKLLHTSFHQIDLRFLHALHIIHEIYTPTHEYIVSFLITAAVTEKYY